jgi:cell division protein DivIC
MESEKVILPKNQKFKKVVKFFRNKYILTITLFTIYALFLDDEDVFSLVSHNRKLSKIHAEQVIMDKKLKETTAVLKDLDQSSSLERFAREEKLFKKDDEDIFIISYK